MIWKIKVQIDMATNCLGVIMGWPQVIGFRPAMMSSKAGLDPCQCRGSGQLPPHNPMANSSHFVPLQASGPGLLAISAKGQQEPSGLMKTGQLTHPHLETCIIYTDPSLGWEGEWGRRQGGCRKRWRRSMEMWSLITVSSAGHLHRTKSLAGAGRNRPAAPGASICVSDTFHYSQWCCV